MTNLRNNYTTRNLFLWNLYTCLILAQSGCEQPQSKREYLARVGDAYLTRQAMDMRGDSTILHSPALLRDYVNRWVDNELLYQEARRQGLEHTEQFRQQLAEVRRQLAVEALLSKELYADTIGLTDDTIRAYFAKHYNDFLLQNDVVKINMATFTAWEHANAFRRMITRGQSWESAIEELLNDPATSPSVVSHVEQRYYTQQTLFPPELWRVAINIGRGEISFPVKIQNTYTVIQTLGSLKRGSPAELELVQNEIRQRLLIEQRRRRYSQLLTRLQSQSDVEIATP